MTPDTKGKELFIVDNSISGWTGLRYLEEWSGIAKGFDIATGYFEIGSLLALDGKWQGLDKIRILMGAETSERTRNALFEAVRARATAELDKSIETDKSSNPFLRGVPSILEALISRKIECRVYGKDKFHAKAYITHARLEVVGSQALVGSSNFTKPGLTKNIELNVQIQSAREVAQLQEWFEAHWNIAQDVTDSIIETVDRHVREYSPFDVYAKALQQFFRGHEMTDSEWEDSRSKLFSQLDRYQKEAYWALMKIARQHGGAFLCDGVGLGKTFVGLMLIEHLVLHDGKRVVLFAPKAAKEGVWEPHLKRYLPHIGGIGGSADFSNLAVFSHTDFSRQGDFPARFRRIAELADAVIIDEAHHFRNVGTQGSGPDDPRRSRYYKLYDLLDNSSRPKTLFMLTATPINNRLSDLRHLIELFSKRDEAYFARTLGVNNLRAYFNNLEKQVRKSISDDSVDLSEHLAEAQQVLGQDEIIRHLVVQRSRVYARESQLREKGSSAIFPVRNPPTVAEYSIRKTYIRLLQLFEKAFEKQHPLFSLAIYYPLAYYKKNKDAWEENRQRMVVGLIRTQFLKRFESSVCAFELSCDRLMKKLLAFLEVHAESNAEKGRLESWRRKHTKVLGHVEKQRQLLLWGQFDPEDAEEDIVPEEFLEAAMETKLSREDYDVGQIVAETYRDLDQIVEFLEETEKFEPKHDDKLKKLIRLLASKDLRNQKVLVFTEFADTARYLLSQLKEAGIEGVEEVDSMSTENRADIIKRFAPYYNEATSGELAAEGLHEIRVLVSTDVLSEGLNLQDATKIVNYDIHWNPVRLMQRIGRVDRRMNPTIERQLLTDHPELEECRGKVDFWNFLPPGELNALLTLYRTVTQKTLLISKTLGIEGKKLLTPEDEYEALKEFNHAYEGEKTAIEAMLLEYQSLLQSDPALERRLKALPGSVFSGRRRPENGINGVFFCFALPALDKEFQEFTEEAGSTRWYFYDLSRDTILDNPNEIIGSIRSQPDTPRHSVQTEKTLLQIRQSVEKHIKNTYLRSVDAPVGVKPILKCWMEINEG